MPNIGSLLLAYTLGTCVSALSPAAIVAQSSAPVEAAGEANGEFALGEMIGAIQPRMDQWARFLDETRGRADAAERIEAYRKEHGVPLSFWEPEEEVTEPPRFAMAHPCGGAAAVFVDRLPGQEEAVTGDVVREFDATGKTLRKWMIPIDSIVKGVEGEEILLPISFSKVTASAPEEDEQVEALLSIRSDGRFRVLPPRTLSEPKVERCPAGLAESDYLDCWVFSDLDGGKVRHLAYEGPCT